MFTEKFGPNWLATYLSKPFKAEDVYQYPVYLNLVDTELQ